MSKQSWYRIEVNRGNPAVAEIYLHDEIGLYGVTSKEFATELRAVTAPAIKLHINSPGGSVDDGIAIFNALKSHSATVDVFVDALAASIASVIAMAGDRVVMAPHSRMMIHEAMAMGAGFAGDFDRMANRLRETSANIASIYSERAGHDTDYWLGLMADETWFSDQQAVDAGLADEVGRDYDEANFRMAASFNLSRYRKAPTFDVAPLKPERAQLGETTTLSASLAGELFEAFTDCVGEWIEAGTVSIAEGANLLSILMGMLDDLDRQLSASGLGERAVEMEEDPWELWDGLRKGGRERAIGHPVFEAIAAIHEKACEHGEHCPLIATKGPDAIDNPGDAARRELELALANVQL